MNFINDDIINKAIKLHSKENRKNEWNYLEITPKQIRRLKKYISEDNIKNVDRGAACILISLIDFGKEYDKIIQDLE